MLSGRSCRSPTRARSRGRWPAPSPRRSRERRHADDRAERLGRVDLVVGGHAVDDRRVVEEPGVGVADEAVARVVGGDPAGARSSRSTRVVVARSARASPRSARRSARGASGRRGRPRVGSPIGGLAQRARRARRRTRRGPTRGRSPCRATCSAGRRCRSPPNSAPSTARSRSASSITTIGFLPPSSRHGDCRWRPHSSPILAPTALEPVKPTLSTSRSSSARSRPANVCAPVGLDEVEHAAGHAAARGRARPARRPAPASTRPASRRPRCRTGSPARGTRTARRRGSCRR